MWATIRTIRLFTKSLVRIALALESLRSLYELDLAARGIVPQDPTLTDRVEVQYGSGPETED